MTTQYRESKFQIKIIHFADSDTYFYFPEVKEKNNISCSLLCSVNIVMQLKPSQITLLFYLQYKPRLPEQNSEATSIYRRGEDISKS